MHRFASLTKLHVLGLIGVLALAIVAANAIAGVLVFNQASAHEGDATLIHACVNTADAQTRIAHPGPGNENTDCTNLGADWSNVDWGIEANNCWPMLGPSESLGISWWPMSTNLAIRNPTSWTKQGIPNIKSQRQTTRKTHYYA